MYTGSYLAIHQIYKISKARSGVNQFEVFQPNMNEDGLIIGVESAGTPQSHGFSCLNLRSSQCELTDQSACSKHSGAVTVDGNRSGIFVALWRYFGQFRKK